MIRKSRIGKLFAGFLALCLACMLVPIGCLAAEPYTYRVTLYAGNHGSFISEKAVSVSGSADYKIDKTPSTITISNLSPGARVTLDAALDGAVQLEKGSKYYIMGVRQSGQDNDEARRVSNPEFEVTEDVDYVVAYGIKGKLVRYVVNYEDTQGNRLAPSQTYYGNVGDRPVVAHLYIEGYQPQAYNLTRTLSDIEAQNVFTFVYTAIGTGGGAADAGLGAGEETEVEIVEGGAAAGAGAGGAAAGAGAGGAGAGADAGAAAADEGVEVPDEEVPEAAGPEELIDLDDEEVPLAVPPMEEGTRNMMGAVAIGATAASALLILTVVLVRRRKKAVVKDTEN